MATDPVMSVVVATTNPSKLAEIRALLDELPVEVLSAAEALGQMSAVVEDGTTFQANALKKARQVSSACVMITLADDSGLEVEALGGQPGVRSARFAAEGATDAENNAKLLEQMQDIDDEHRRASFRCAIALVDPWAGADSEICVDGRCDGRIARKPSGTGGFGYDPLFVVDGLDRTMAELSEEEKNRVSHRGVALAALAPRLTALIEARLQESATILEAPSSARRSANGPDKGGRSPETK